jgi:hypothetical protein
VRLSRRLSGNIAGTAALSLLFFVLYYLYLWLVVDLRLIYHGGGAVKNFPVFYLGWGFFREYAFWPGGLVEYAGNFLGQFFYIGWAGALVATVQAWLLWLWTGSILKMAIGRRLGLVCFVLPILLLALYARYGYPLGVAMDLLVTLGFMNLYMRAASKRRPADLPVFAALSIILYAITGGAYVLFVVVCGIYELFLRRRAVLGTAFLLLGAIIAYILSEAVFKISIVDTFNDFRSAAYEGTTIKLPVIYALYLVLPAVLAGSALVEQLRKSWAVLTGQPRPVTRTAKDDKKSEQIRFARLKAFFTKAAVETLASLVAIAAGVLVAFFYHNPRLKMEIAANYYSCNNMWDEVLKVAAKCPQSKFISHAANRALYHTGRLTQEMFTYGQQPDGLMLSNETANPLGWWRLFDTYIDLGHINMAEASLVLLMDAYGERPVFLKRLVLVNMVKGNVPAAKVCLGALSRTLFDASWARGYLGKIERDPNSSEDKEIQQLRTLMPEIDRDFAALDESIFLDLLDKNKHNRMAFEYLMAYYLLTNRLEQFAGNLEHLNDFDYAGIPRVYEEAILFYEYTAKKNVEVPGRTISTESRKRFNNFLMARGGWSGADKNALFKKLAKDYGDSYFFYSVYRRSGMTQ